MHYSLIRSIDWLIERIIDLLLLIDWLVEMGLDWGMWLFGFNFIIFSLFHSEQMFKLYGNFIQKGSLEIENQLFDKARNSVRRIVFIFVFWQLFCVIALRRHWTFLFFFQEEYMTLARRLLRCILEAASEYRVMLLRNVFFPWCKGRSYALSHRQINHSHVRRPFFKGLDSKKELNCFQIFPNVFDARWMHDYQGVTFQFIFISLSSFVCYVENILVYCSCERAVWTHRTFVIGTQLRSTPTRSHTHTHTEQ